MRRHLHQMPAVPLENAPKLTRKSISRGMPQQQPKPAPRYDTLLLSRSRKRLRTRVLTRIVVRLLLIRTQTRIQIRTRLPPLRRPRPRLPPHPLRLSLQSNLHPKPPIPCSQSSRRHQWRSLRSRSEHPPALHVPRAHFDIGALPNLPCRRGSESHQRTVETCADDARR